MRARLGRSGPGAVRGLLGRPGDAPRATCVGSLEESDRLVAAVHWVTDPELLDAGDEVDGWRVEVLRGHADGHIVLASRRRADRRRHDPRAGSPRRSASTRTRGPTRSATTSRRSTGSRSSRRASPTRGTRVRSRDPAGRAREIRAHHVERLDRAAAALDRTPRSAVRDLAVALRRRAPDDVAPLRDGGGACAPRAARAREPGGPRGLRLRHSRLNRADTIPAWSRFGSAFSPCRETSASTLQMLRRLGADAVEVRKPTSSRGSTGSSFPAASRRPSCG